MTPSIYDWRSNNTKLKLREPLFEACYTCHERETYHCHQNCTKVEFPVTNVPETKLELTLKEK